MYQSTIEAFLGSPLGQESRGEVQLLFTSPPFPLNRKKRYGNEVGEDYLKWLGGLAERLGDLLTDDGSFVVELGNAWEKGEPVMSTLGLKAMLELLEQGGFHLCQQFVAHNPARLPSPAQWVNIERMRVKDAYTHIWWMSRNPRPKADNRRVLQGYSKAMEKLLKRGSYNAGVRPSQHNIGQTSFLSDNGGAIPSNVLTNIFTVSNTVSTDAYRRYCKVQELEMHPARMQPELVEFFIRFLTEEGDLVCDPFGGSNTTGAGAEALKRRWIATEPRDDFIAGSYGRFLEARLRRPDGLALDPQAIVRYLQEQEEPRTRKEIAEDLGIVATAKQWSKALNILIEEGLVVAEGNTRARMYCVTGSFARSE